MHSLSEPNQPTGTTSPFLPVKWASNAPPQRRLTSACLWMTRLQLAPPVLSGPQGKGKLRSVTQDRIKDIRNSAAVSLPQYSSGPQLERPEEELQHLVEAVNHSRRILRDAGEEIVPSIALGRG